MAKDKRSNPDYEPDEQENKKGIKSFMSKFLSNFVEEVEADEEVEDDDILDSDDIDEDDDEDDDDDFDDDLEDEDDDEFEEDEEDEEISDDDIENENQEFLDDENKDEDELEEPDEILTDVPPEFSEIPDSLEIQQFEESSSPEGTTENTYSETLKEPEESADLLFDAPEDMPDFREDAVPKYDSDAITLDEDSKNDDFSEYFNDSEPEFFDDVNDNKENNDEEDDEEDEEDDENSPKKKSFLSIAIPIAFVLVLGLGFAYCFQLGLFDEKPTYLMPDFVGMNYYDLGENFNNFDIQISNQEYSTYDKDIICGQDIPAGTEVKLGQTVNIDLSLGYAQTKVPDVKNYQFEYAQKILEQSGFEVELVYEASLNGTAQNNVIRTLPDAGQSVNAGSKITMYVSEGLGADSAQVQTFTGMLLDEAMALCETYGLRVETIPVPSLQPENVVVEQSIEAGTKVPFHTVITLAYSSGEQPQGIVDYQINFPPYANGRFILDFINIYGDVVASSDIIVAGFSAGSTIPVQGTGSQEIKVILNNYTTNLQAELGTYSFDFTTGTYAIISEDMQKAFEDVKGIGNN